MKAGLPAHWPGDDERFGGLPENATAHGGIEDGEHLGLPPEAAADRHDVGAEDIDAERQRLGDELDVTVEGADRVGFAGAPGLHDGTALHRQAGEVAVQPLHAAGAADGVDAAALAAAAGKPRDVDRRVADPACQDRSVAPFAGEAAGTVEEAAIDDHAAADAGAEDDAEDDAVATAGADAGFGKGEAVGVVGDQHRAAERGA